MAQEGERLIAGRVWANGRPHAAGSELSSGFASFAVAGAKALDVARSTDALRF